MMLNNNVYLKLILTDILPAQYYTIDRVESSGRSKPALLAIDEHQ